MICRATTLGCTRLALTDFAQFPAQEPTIIATQLLIVVVLVAAELAAMKADIIVAASTIR
jgi:hypothetical protein